MVLRTMLKEANFVRFKSYLEKKIVYAQMSLKSLLWTEAGQDSSLCLDGKSLSGAGAKQSVMDSKQERWNVFQMRPELKYW